MGTGVTSNNSARAGKEMQTRVWGWRENSVIRVLATQVKGPEPGSPVPHNVGWDGEPLVIPVQRQGPWEQAG